MSRHTEKADEISILFDTPTEFPTEGNKYGINCEGCGGLFYVDEATYSGICSAVEFDPSDIPFRCDDCLQEDEEEGVY
jgi:hypothetical protein